MARDSIHRPRVFIIGGGLAGLAAATALAETHVSVELFEARRNLGGRSGSFVDSTSGESIDHCQHVGMGCCTNLQDFCRRTEIGDLFQRYDQLHFFSPAGRRCDFRGSRWLPSPLHLAGSFLRLNFLSWRERLGIARALWKLARTDPHNASETIGQWLKQQKQSNRAVENFWSVVLVSALGESVERASFAAARKVFVDGFLSHRDAYKIDVPTVSLNELYGRRVPQRLAAKNVKIHLETPVKMINGDRAGVRQIELRDGTILACDHAVLAVPWKRAGELLCEELHDLVPELAQAAKLESSPIAGVHLWFDRKITDLPHAVVVGRLSQWVFPRGELEIPENTTKSSEHYVQVVISASRNLAGRSRDSLIEEIQSDLRAIFPAAKSARVLRWRLVDQQEAVFSATPASDALRPLQVTKIPNLFLAGDWTQTGWPSTMEGAVRSGYLAAEGVMRSIGEPQKFFAPDMPRCRLARMLFK